MGTLFFLLSWMFQHDYFDTCCFECLLCMCFVFWYLHLFRVIEHVSHGKALQKYAYYCYYYYYFAPLTSAWGTKKKKIASKINTVGAGAHNTAAFSAAVTVTMMLTAIVDPVYIIEPLRCKSMVCH